MERLFTFGCSFTNWNWPTWADLLGYSFLLHQNWGVAGIGNRAIAERVAECHVINRFCENDVVIVQWSSHLRNDYARTDILDGDSMWKTRGSPTSLPNQDLYNEHWFKKFWDQKAYYIHTLNNVVLVQQLLESTGCKWYMVDMSDLTRISFFDESTEVEIEKQNAFDSFPELLHYKQYIWEDRKLNWLPSISEEKWTSSDLDWVFDTKESKDFFPFKKSSNEKFTEPHLTVLQNANYLKKLNIEIPLYDERITEAVEQYEKIYQDSNHSWKDFMDKIYKTEFIKFKGHYGK